MQLCIIKGDGIGPEVVDAALCVLQATGLDIQTVEAAAGWGTFQATGIALPEVTLEMARAADAIFFGAVASPSHSVPGYRSPIVALRRELDLYANVRPVSNAGLPGSDTQPPVDLVVVRENTEGLYAGRERLEDDGATAIAERVITRHGSERIVRQACKLALSRRRHVTLVHKANVLRITDGLFRQAALDVAANYADITLAELLVDTAAMHLAQSPARFDVIVTTNMFGDILSDIACIHGGGLGLASSANIGDHQALFEPVHGAAPDIVGQGIANPLAAIGCMAMLLEWASDRADAESLDQLAAWAQRIRQALSITLRIGPHTPDMGGTATTSAVVTALIERL